MLLLPPRSTLFPYTTLFRSRVALEERQLPRHQRQAGPRGGVGVRQRQELTQQRARFGEVTALAPDLEDRRADHRSEEHTSELQSLRHLVCRLLLEKKKQTHQ